jgi:hypothetical protein
MKRIARQAPMPYNFAWAVKDDYTYNDYAHQESSDDKGYVTGSYRTLLPDGRTQIVTYKADDYSGYVADVKYDGEAKYQEYKPSGYKPAAYPSPAYPSYPAYPAINRRTISPHILLPLTPNIKVMTGVSGSLTEDPCNLKLFLKIAK